MITSTTTASRRTRIGPRPCFEPLEGRRLLSGTWTTVDSVPTSTPRPHYAGGLAADTAGNVYAVGPFGGGQILIREKPSGSSSFMTLPATLPAQLPGTASTSNDGMPCIATDAAGDVFVNANVADENSTGSNIGYTNAILERAAGQSAFSPVTINLPAGATWMQQGMWQDHDSFAVDSAGDVFLTSYIAVATGTVTTGHGSNARTSTTYADYGELFEMKAGQTSFNPVYQFQNMTPTSVALIDSGPSAGLYVTAASGSFSNHQGIWIVSKSTDGGSTWVTVDSLSEAQYDPTGSQYVSNADMAVRSVVGDSSGNGHLFVTGYGVKFIFTGYTYTKVNGKLVANPNGYFERHWLTRESDDGGATWQTVDDVPPASSTGLNQPWGIADLGGTVYVVGQQTQSDSLAHAIARTNAGGTWQTVDDYADAAYAAVTIDPTTGTPYAGGHADLSSGAYTWTIRSGPAPASPSTAPATTASSLLAPALSPGAAQSTSLFDSSSSRDDLLALLA